ncbi:ArnT family glycosyltransferase [Enterobacter cloacae]|uniref:ArnT family glycosyltransferase n=1 Tax=Enterobacter cloacae TaxID=550 RepID=UPI0013D0224F|nr:hypothetical protein [Enterobacter cloacae]
MDKNAKTFVVFFSLLVIYLLPGIFGHTPWKQDENYTFGVIQSMYETGNWLVPINAGEPFMEKPPLYYWTATLTMKLWSGLIPLHDAARSATLFFSALNFCFFILLAKRVFKAENFQDFRIWVAFTLYICAPGILKHSHDMFSDTALTAGATIGLYGIQGLINQEKIRSSVLFLSAGTVVSMLSKGIFIPGLLWMTLIISPLFLTSIRSRDFWRNCIFAGIISSVFIIPWPVLLYLKHPTLFIEWFWENNIGRFLGFSVPELGAKANQTRIPVAIFFFALPSGILSVIHIIRNPLKRIFSREEFAITFFMIMGLIILQLSASSRALYLLPFVASMAILGSKMLSALKPSFISYFTIFSSILWSMIITFIWVIYILKLTLYKHHPLPLLERWLPASFDLHFTFLPCIFAVGITFFWIGRFWLCKFLNPMLDATLSWSLGTTVVWGLVFTLLVGWIDYTKGYEGVFSGLKTQLVSQYRSDDCMASLHIGESEAPMLYYYTGILHQPQQTFIKPKTCRWLIVLTDAVQSPPKGMQLFWIGNRPGDQHHKLVVYESNNKTSHTVK